MNPLSPLKIGVLALQGDYAAHIRALAEAGASAVPVRDGGQLESVDAMVIPGGESTVMGSLLERFGFLDLFRHRIEDGMPVFGTCAGLILLARGIEGRKQPTLGVLDITVRRNAYGTQIDSFRTRLDASALGGGPFEGVFIRAPRIIGTGSGVEVLISHSGEPVMVRQGNIVGATFHPELVPGQIIHRWFVGMAGRGIGARDSAPNGAMQGA